MIAPRATIQGMLSQGVSRTSLERVFVARSQPRGRGVAISILAYCPVDAAPPRPMIQSVRWAARSATACARTLLLTARYNGHRPDRSDMLFAVPVIPDGEQPWGALVALGSPARAGGGRIDSLDGVSRQLAARLSAAPRPARAVSGP